MDPDLFGIFMFILAIVVGGLTTGILIHRRSVEHEERKLELKARIEEAKAQQTGNQRQATEDMEERMRVLERIVTDPSADLSRQIEDLRAQQSAGEERVS